MRRFTVPAVIVGCVALVLLALLPPAQQHTEAPPATTIRGAFHIHSNRSDGGGSVDDIAAAAARAGLQFVVITDHGDGTRVPDPPTYRSGVLVIDGVEISTSGGHYAVAGMPASPYPLAGAPAEVIEDVERMGGFGIAAHPGSPRPSLAWRDWDAPIEGLEWINSDSEWRDEPTLPIARALITYLFRAPESIGALLDRDVSVMQRWDELASRRRVVGLAGADAHARLGFRQRTDPDISALHVPLPGYEPSFATFSNHLELDAPLSGDASADASRVLNAMRLGRAYTVIDAFATPGALSFTATSGPSAASVGGVVHATVDVLLHASAKAPPGTTLVLLRNGQRIHEVTDAPLDTNGGKDRAAYRVEAYLRAHPSVPWIVSNPIYVDIDREPGGSASAAVTARIPARTAETAMEFGANDVSRIDVGEPQDVRARTFAGDPAINWSFSLGAGPATGQFAAIPIPVSPGLETFERVRFTVSSPKPMRAWVQLRAPVGQTERWGATFYADSEPRTVDVPFSRFRPIGVTSSVQPPLAQVRFLLFVVDTLNTLPGTTGSMTLSDIAFVK